MHVHDLFIPGREASGSVSKAPALVSRRWCGDTAPRFVVGIVHGMGEHADRYKHVAEYFVSQGATALAIDQRGHGRTGGSLPHFDILVEDIGRLENYLHDAYPSVPVFLYGQSLGGSIVANYVLRKKNRLAGAISMSPLFRTTFPPPAWKLAVAKALGKWWPNLTLSTAIKSKDLSRDPRAVDAYIKDTMVHQRVSAVLGLSMLDAGQWAVEHAGELQTPMLLMHGTDDRITSHAASQEFASRSNQNCTWVSWRGLYHDMHCEPENQDVLNRIFQFIDQQIACGANRVVQPR
ncbi:MAG: alpha/beta hydrolase [Planctomycetaceae bacterium]|jgi:acylglycerol lipase|nr:alpha/beta hydrolase [Planctomycetaceae bacterium]MCE2812542.1 alpha/beta hydrolase [Planctomycetaceae bacterium]